MSRRATHAVAVTRDADPKACCKVSGGGEDWPVSIASQRCGKSGKVFAVVPMSATPHPGQSHPNDGAKGRHDDPRSFPMRHHGGGRNDVEAIVGFLSRPAQSFNLGNKSFQPVGLVTAQVGDADQGGRSGGEQAQGRNRVGASSPQGSRSSSSPSQVSPCGAVTVRLCCRSKRTDAPNRGVVPASTFTWSVRTGQS